jgi:hypothetical protein
MDGIIYRIPDAGTRTFSRRSDGRWYAPVSSSMKAREVARVFELGALLAADTSRHLLAISEARETCSGSTPPAGCALGYILDGQIELFEKDHSLGWLSPFGMRFIPCEHYGHGELASILHENGVPGLEKAGWCRLKTAREYWGEDHEATDGQARWILQHRP